MGPWAPVLAPSLESHPSPTTGAYIMRHVDTVALVATISLLGCSASDSPSREPNAPSGGNGVSPTGGASGSNGNEQGSAGASGANSTGVAGNSGAVPMPTP